MDSPMDPERLVVLRPERVEHILGPENPGHIPEITEKLRLNVTRLSNRSIEFDLIHADASVANSLRRVLIAEVPTMCVEDVFVLDNTSVIQDEVLAQRVGMVPLNADPELFVYREESNGQATDRNTLVFHLNVACTRNTNAPPNSTDPDVLYNHSSVTSGDMVWVPQGEQGEIETLRVTKPGPTNPNIVLAKLRPGQEISLEMHAIKGVGKEHAKWSPVATASYRLLPDVQLLKSVPLHLADQLISCFGPGVIKKDTSSGIVSVDPACTRNDSMSREVFRHPELAEYVKLGRVRDHFLFTIESEGPYAPERLLPTAIGILRQKLAALKVGLDALTNNGDDAMDAINENDEPINAA